MTDELTPRQGRKLFDGCTRQHLGISGDEFLRRYDAGDIPTEWPHDVVVRLEFLIPFARRVPATSKETK